MWRFRSALAGRTEQLRLDLGGLAGPAHEVALRLVAALALEQRQLGFALDTFRDDAEAEVVGEAYDRGNGATILLIEHNMSVVMEMADQVTVLNFGEVLAEGTPQQIHENAAVQAAYLGTG